jgi:hypothetical protein
MNRQNNSLSDMSSLTSMIIFFETRSDRWNAIDLKFFDLIYDEKILITIELIQHVEKDTYFRDVHLFIDRVKNFVVAKRAEIVRNNLYTCLRGSIMTWYTAKVSREEKKLLKMRNNIDVWKRYLLKRFRKRFNVIMITITRERYTLDDARRRRESREYAGIIMRAAKSAELDSKLHLIMLIYNDLDLKFQRDISMSELITNIQNFLQCLDDKKNIWWRLINRQSFRFDNTRTRNSYNNFYNDQFRTYFQSEQQSFDQYDFQNAAQRIDQWSSINSSRFSYQFEWANQRYQSQQQTFSNANQLKASKTQLQITVDSSKKFAFSSKSNFFRLTENFIFRSKNYIIEQNQERYERSDRFFERAWNQENWNNRSRSQDVYVENTLKKNSNISRDYQNQTLNQDSESVMNENDKKNEDSHDSENRRFEEFSYFLNEDDYHIDTEVIKQNSSQNHQCRKCKKRFASNNKLHRHVRECRKIKSTIKFFESRLVESFHLNNDVSRIITSTTKLDLIKNLTFRSWHFATFFARIFKEASLNELCVDSECIMSLIDRTYLMKILSHIKIHHVDDSVKIRDIDIAVHDCFEYIVLKIFISEFKEIAKLTRQAHVVNNLRAKFFMSMNILESEKMILDIFRQKMILFLCENLEIDIRITSKLDSKINRVILAERLVTVSARTIASVLIRMKSKIVSDRNYLF